MKENEKKSFGFCRGLFLCLFSKGSTSRSDHDASFSCGACGDSASSRVVQRIREEPKRNVRKKRTKRRVVFFLFSSFFIFELMMRRVMIVAMLEKNKGVLGRSHMEKKRCLGVSTFRGQRRLMVFVFLSVLDQTTEKTGKKRITNSHQGSQRGRWKAPCCCRGASS